MDIIFNLLKQLSSTLSPPEFLVVLVIITVSVWTIVKFLIKHIPKNHIRNSIFGLDESTSSLDSVQIKLELMESSQSESLSKIMSAVVELRNNNEKYDDIVNKQMVDLIILKKDIDQMNLALHEKLEDIKQQFKSRDLHDHQVFDVLKESQSKLQEIVSKTTSQLEKIDEHTRGAILDFKSSHKDLGKNLSDLSRDIALVERSVQNQINSVNAIKLR